MIDNKIFIGDNFPYNFCCIKISNLPEEIDISEHDLFYTVHNYNKQFVLDSVLYITKDTDEGKHLSHFIEDIKKADKSEYDSFINLYIAFIDSLIIKNTPVSVIKDILAQIEDESFNNGFKSAQSTIRESLGL